MQSSPRTLLALGGSNETTHVDNDRCRYHTCAYDLVCLGGSCGGTTLGLGRRLGLGDRCGHRHRCHPGRHLSPSPVSLRRLLPASLCVLWVWAPLRLSILPAEVCLSRVRILASPLALSSTRLSPLAVVSAIGPKGSSDVQTNYRSGHCWVVVVSQLNVDCPDCKGRHQGSGGFKGAKAIVVRRKLGCSHSHVETRVASCVSAQHQRLSRCLRALRPVGAGSA